jgi:hypothetical protein
VEHPGAKMKVAFMTENGTWYVIDQEKMTWSRKVSTVSSGKTRHDGGKLLSLPTLRLGESAFLEDEDILPGHVAHYVQTSRVKIIQELA